MAAPDPPLDLRVHRRVAWSTTTNLATQVVTLAIGFLLTPFILHYVGPASFGLWVVVASLVGYGGLLDLGISSAIIKYVAEHRARDDMAEAQRLTATAVALYSAVGAVLALSGAAIAPFVGGILGLERSTHHTAAVLTILVALEIGLSFPFTVPTAFLRGLQRFDLVNLVAVARSVLAAGLIVAFLLAGGGIVSVVVANLVTAVVSQGFAIWLARRAAPEFRPGWRGADWGVARKVLSFSWSVSVVQMAGLVTNRSDAIVIAAFRPLRAVTAFSLAQRLSEMVLQLPNQFLRVLLPLASELDRKRDEASLRAVFLTGTRLAFGLAVPIAIVVSVLASAILSAWVGAAYAGQELLVWLLAAAFVVDVLVYPAGSILVGMGRQRPLAWMAATNGVANLALSVALVRPLGLKGVAIGTLAPNVAEAFFLVLPYVMRTIGVSAREIVAKSIAPHLVPTAVTTGLLWLARRQLDPTSIPALLALAAAVASVYGVLYLAHSATKTERAFLLSLAHGVRRRFTAARHP